MAGFTNRLRVLKAALAIGAASCAVTGGIAAAQDASATRQSVSIDIPAGNLGDALIALGRQAKVQIAFLPDRVAGRKVRHLRGNFTIDEALRQLLRDSGLRVQRLPNGSYVVGGPTKANLDKAKRLVADAAADQGYVNGDANIPEILVTGRRSLTLNTDIPRSKDEAQPYTVYSREQIKRSGALNLEDFLRDNLGAATSVRTSAQGGGVTSRDSVINLRGIGLNGTLILVDGRRYAEPNSGIAGTFVQSSVVGIPLDQIERVEVLASSAAGQYGSNAVGGVINIILRRDFHGMEASAYVGGTTKGDAMERRLSLNATYPILPKTTLTLSGSWKKSDPLYAGDTDFINQRLAYILENNPKYLETAPLIYSTTPNIRSDNGSKLVLKPAYAVNGVTALNSAVTYLPAGYRGIALDGASALLANAGRQNVEPSSGDAGGPILGDRYALLTGSTVWNGTATVRSDITSWLSLYGSGSYSRVEATSDSSPVPSSVTLAANNPLNPFTTAINVSFPSDEPFVTSRSKSETVQFIGGAIARLPWHWQLNLDVNTSTSTADAYNSKRQLSPAFYSQLVSNPSINVLLDTLANPIDFQYDTDGHYSRRSPSKSSYTSYTAKLAGPIGFARLWGGTPVVTLVVEKQRQWFGDSIGYTDGPGQSSVSYSPERSLNTKSAYGELVLPVIGADNHVPLIHGFELRLSGRYDGYTGVGTSTTFQCVNIHPGVLTPAEEDAPCPAPNMAIPYREVRNHSINPVVAAKWSVTPDIAFRGSYSTGYTPPLLNNVVETPGLALLGFTSGIGVSARDPLRGNERIGTPLFGGILYLIEGISGGNPNVEPQRSDSWSYGTILTPRFLKGLTLRADWTRIRIENGYYNPQSLLSAQTPQEQAALLDFMEAYPDRFKRGPVPAGDPYSVGPIIYIDARTANLSKFTSEAIDFSTDYVTQIGQGQLTVTGAATLLLHMTSQLTPSATPVDITGVVSTSNFYSNGDSLKFKGNISASYSTRGWNFGLRARHYSGYYVNALHTVVLEQGSNRVNAQTYLDLFGGVKLARRTELSLGLNNVLNTRPPYDVTRSSGYAPSGDPRMRTFYANVTQRF